jgi:hypothetical protein
MALSRRNILVGLGALVGGGGALVSTGAFSTVSAERSVSVNTTGDASSFLGLNATSQGQSYINNPTSGTLDISLGSSSNGFNEDAITTIGSLFNIINNSPEGETIDIAFSTNGPSTSGVGTGTDPTIQLGVAPNSGGSVNSVVTLAILKDSSISDINLNSDGTISSDPNSGDSVSLSVADSLVPVGVIVDTRDNAINNSSIPNQNNVTIVAEGQ